MQIIGHEPQLNQLKQAAQKGQLANAYLLTGTEGIGKKLAVTHFAMWLFCASGNKPCENCPICQKIKHNTHPDFLIISVEEDKKDISIEQMRQMQGRVQMHPMEAPRKIIIIDDAERMNSSAANSILKVLEEPPNLTHFFLISSRPHMLLPTIISRCQKITFSPPPQDKIVDHLIKTKGIDKITAQMLTELTNGSLGMSLNFPLETVDDVIASLKKIWGKSIKPSEIIAIAERWGKSDVNPAAILTVLTGIYHDIWAMQNTQQKPAVFNELSNEMTAIAQNSPRHVTQKRISLLIVAQSDIEATYNKQLLFEQLLFTLAGQ